MYFMWYFRGYFRGTLGVLWGYSRGYFRGHFGGTLGVPWGYFKEYFRGHFRGTLGGTWAPLGRSASGDPRVHSDGDPCTSQPEGGPVAGASAASRASEASRKDCIKLSRKHKKKE